MIPSLRRAALAASAVLVLALPAAAQGDAGFASALGKLPSGLATMAQLKTQQQAPSAAPFQGPPVAEDAWMKIINYVRNNGEYSPAPPGAKFDTYNVLDTAREPMLEFTHMGIDMLAQPVISPSLRIGAVRFAAVKVIHKGNEKRLESYEYVTGYSGRLKSALFAVMTIDAQGKITGETSIDLNIAEPLIAARFDAIIKYWADR